MDLGPVIFDLVGFELTKIEQELLKHPLIGGIILFTRNYEEPEQLSRLVQSIRSVKPNALIMVDQEGGRVQRFKEGFTKLPNLRLLGELYDANPESQEKCLAFAFQLGLLMALEVRSFDIDLSLAPVVDLDKKVSAVIGDRAFHSDPNVVVSLATAYMSGMQQASMAATLKHFPGHGGVAPDSHHELPIDNRNLSELQEDIEPFRQLCHHANTGAVMPAHILYPKLDSKPPCFSTYWLQDILRQQLKFNGVIISDDLSMEGASSMGSYCDKARAALEAGCDTILICNHREGTLEVLDGLNYQPSKESILRMQKLRKPHSLTWHDIQHSKLWKGAQETLQGFMRQCMFLNPTMV